VTDLGSGRLNLPEPTPALRGSLLGSCNYETISNDGSSCYSWLSQRTQPTSGVQRFDCRAIVAGDGAGYRNRTGVVGRDDRRRTTLPNPLSRRWKVCRPFWPTGELRRALTCPSHLADLGGERNQTWGSHTNDSPTYPPHQSNGAIVAPERQSRRKDDRLPKLIQNRCAAARSRATLRLC
jgi:hypothetical protein